MPSLSRLVQEQTDLSVEDAHELTRLVEDWGLLADLALSDLVLWVPTWNEGGLIAVAQVRPTTAPTSVPDDAVGEFSPRGRTPEMDQALAFGRSILARKEGLAYVPSGLEAYPLVRAGRTIAVVVRHTSPSPRVVGRIEEIYLRSADDLLSMVVEGTFPGPAARTEGMDSPRVGDGLVRLDHRGTVSYASPNAISALRRLGLATDIVGTRFSDLAIRLSHRPGPMDENLSAVASGRTSGQADIENASASVVLRGFPLLRDGQQVGAILFVRDATDMRRRDRALISKDATIREVHHRVKNNLQTVAAMLRLQARRAHSDEAREALAEAELRVGAIAVVHEVMSAEAAQQVTFDEVVDRIITLVRDLAPAYSSTMPVISRTGSWGTLAGDMATPLAMVASELLHNAVEHAAARAITVTLSRTDDALHMNVRDDGHGLPDDFDLAAAGLGLGIVQSLVTADLQGQWSMQGGADGTVVDVQVPL